MRAHPGREWLVVLSGTAVLLLGNRRFRVETNQAAEFPTMLPHAIGERRAARARSWASSTATPAAGTSARTRRGRGGARALTRRVGAAPSAAISCAIAQERIFLRIRHAAAYASAAHGRPSTRTHHASTHAPRRHGARADAQAEILDLDAEVLADTLASITAWLPVSTAPAEIVDLGAGPGPAPSRCSSASPTPTSPPSTPRPRTCSGWRRRPRSGGRP